MPCGVFNLWNCGSANICVLMLLVAKSLSWNHPNFCFRILSFSPLDSLPLQPTGKDTDLLYKMSQLLQVCGFFCTESNQNPPNKTTKLALMGQPRKAGNGSFIGGVLDHKPRRTQVGKKKKCD